MSGPVQIAQTHWGKDVPDWILRLANECEASSQNKVAARLKLSPPVISSTLRNKYAGTLKTVEDSVRGVYMSGTITCPALGRIPTNECRSWREKARKFGTANPLRVLMFRACNNCPLNTEGK